MNKSDKIFIAGHKGMVGSGIERKLRSEGYNNIVFKISSELNLKNQAQVDQFFELEKPDYVILAAAKVGGIHANDKLRGDFILENLNSINEKINFLNINERKVFDCKRVCWAG